MILLIASFRETRNSQSLESRNQTQPMVTAFNLMFPSVEYDFLFKFLIHFDFKFEFQFDLTNELELAL